LPPVIKVSVAVPIEEPAEDYEDFTGRTEAVSLVDLRSRISGYLDKVLFADGAEVTKDQQLFQIDPRPFQAAYDKAVADLAVSQADLKYRNAELARSKSLRPSNAISQSEFDKAIAAQATAVAAVTAGQAAVESAKLNLDFTRVASPIDGRASKTAIAAGNLVQADQTLLTTVVSVDWMYVGFDVDEHTWLEVLQNVRAGKIKSAGNEQIPVSMRLANEKGFPHQGILAYSDNRFDPGTGTLRARAKFPNPKPATGDRYLMPGLFCRVRVPLGMPQRALKVAERAIGADLGQKFLLLVDDKNQVHQRPISLGKLEDGLRVIHSGIHAGEKVIVSGLQRVRPGAQVEPVVVDMRSYATAADGADEAAQGDAPAPAGPAPAAETAEKKSYGGPPCFRDSSSTGRFSPPCSRS
jgi:RND family efflux transporter MFP subunit